jgi:hypothetical protein
MSGFDDPVPPGGVHRDQTETNKPSGAGVTRVKEPKGRKSPTERDPLPDQRGKRGRRPGNPDLSDLLGSAEARLGLPAEILLLHVALQRVAEARQPARRKSKRDLYGPSVAQWELAQRVKELATESELRKGYSPDELNEMFGTIAAAVMDISQKLFDRLGEYARLWWVHRQVDRATKFGERLFGQETLGGYNVSADGRRLEVRAEYQQPTDGSRKRPMPRWSPKKVQQMAASAAGLKDVRKLAKDRIGISGIEPRVLKKPQQFGRVGGGGRNRLQHPPCP